MIFWAGIVAAVMLAVGCGRRGLYETWAFAFNSIIAIYIAIFAEPYIAEAIPSARDTAFGGDMLVAAGIALGAFIILHGLSYAFVTGQFVMPFPKILDIGGATILGFFAGLVIWNFGIFAICNIPVFPEIIAENIHYDSKARQFNINVFSRPCNAINFVVSKDSSYTTQNAVDTLLAATEKKQPKEKTPFKLTPRKPKPVEPNTPQQKKELLGPPPEIEPEGF